MNVTEFEHCAQDRHAYSRAVNDELRRRRRLGNFCGETNLRVIDRAWLFVEN